MHHQLPTEVQSIAQNITVERLPGNVLLAVALVGGLAVSGCAARSGSTYTAHNAPGTADVRVDESVIATPLTSESILVLPAEPNLTPGGRGPVASVAPETAVPSSSERVQTPEEQAAENELANTAHSAVESLFAAHAKEVVTVDDPDYPTERLLSLTLTVTQVGNPGQPLQAELLLRGTKTGNPLRIEKPDTIGITVGTNNTDYDVYKLMMNHGSPGALIETGAKDPKRPEFLSFSNDPDWTGLSFSEDDYKVMTEQVRVVTDGLQVGTMTLPELPDITYGLDK
ncbi:MAG: hypothetical protein WBP26_05585 [Candidatus Saccharimonadales bacterium]